ncbi:MAG: cytochrome c-type biosis protein [Actinomycetota bacterium]|jgi:cytochrome c-type biogenesis protein|nr:cytochrome biosis protein CcdA [Cryptosporangiaceae bacterium]MDQ1677106.1 cytochrome c-type biosis protein [Actinomycetota bacterium]
MGITETVMTGPLLVAVGLAVAAGVLSFLSPCVLPLVPGYISYVTGLAGADLDAAVGSDPKGRPVAPAAGSGDAAVDTAERRRVRGRVLAGSGLFVLGFTAVYTVLVTLASTLGAQLLDHADTVQRVVGGVIVLMGLAFLGLVPGLQREFRVRRMPATGLAGAPLLGAVFALGWVPCTGPTLAAVLGLATVEGSVGRGALLAVAYCLGIGIPFVLFGLGFRRLLGAFAVVRRHSAWVTRVGGVMLIAVGLLLLTGFWNDLVIWIRALLPVGEIAL